MHTLNPLYSFQAQYAIRPDHQHQSQNDISTHLTDAMSDTIAVIEKTKKTFKSKELGNLRQRLEDVFEGTLQK